jgi:hypothetical protein
MTTPMTQSTYEVRAIGWVESALVDAALAPSKAMKGHLRPGSFSTRRSATVFVT